MKPKSMKTILLAALLAPGALFAQTTATTTPVGYVSLGNTASSTAIAANTDAFVGIPFHRQPVGYGVVSSTTANTVTFAETQNFGDLTSTPHVLLIESGVNSGVCLPITANTATVVTVDLGIYSLTGTVANDKISVRPAWTIQSFMAGCSSLTGVRLLTYSNSAKDINNSADGLYFFVGGGNWETGDGDPANNIILYPGEGFIVRTGDTPISSFVVAGEVPRADSFIPLGRSDQSGGKRDTFFTYTSPVGEQLQNSGLGISSGDQLIEFNNTEVGINRSGVPYFFANGNWENGDGDPAGQVMLEPGKSYIYRSNTSVAPSTPEYNVWKDQPTYIPSL